MGSNNNGGYLSKSEYQAGMELELPSVETNDSANKPLLFGTSTEGVIPAMPGEDEFQFPLHETLRHLKPANESLHPPHTPHTQPSPGRFFPSPPPGGYTLLETQNYLRGYVYAADYDISTLDDHRKRLMNIEMPPLMANPLDGKPCVTGMVQMVPGVPFVFKFNGDSQRMHTLGCLQTLESLKPYPDYNQVLNASVHLAKLSWGYSDGDQATVPAVYDIEGLKPNDRSATRPFLDNTRDGSYSLGHTVMKGDGLGTVLPSVQANSIQADIQIRAILRTLHTLRRLVMPKCLSKFEHDIWDFHQDYNNVFSFGGLAPNGTSVQLNVSSLGIDLDVAIGILQGFWHTDCKDDCQFWTFFVLLFRIGPDGDPGQFFLARGGVYIHELGIWILFIVFKGTDPHTGVAPREDAERHAEWVKSIVDPMWNMAGPQNRLGYVNYISTTSSKRSGSMNVTPATRFGNYGSHAAHKAMQKDFATHGHTTMGSPSDHAERLGRELVSNLYNAVALSPNLTLDCNPDDILQLMSYQVKGVRTACGPYPYNPVRDELLIRQNLSWYAWHLSESNLFNLGITSKMIKSAAAKAPVPSSSTLLDEAIDLVLEPDCTTVDIQEVLGRRIVSGKAIFTIRLEENDQLFKVPTDHPCIRTNKVVQDWLMKQIKGPDKQRRNTNQQHSNHNEQYLPTSSHARGESEANLPGLPTPENDSATASAAEHCANGTNIRPVRDSNLPHTSLPTAGASSIGPPPASTSTFPAATRLSPAAPPPATGPALPPAIGPPPPPATSPPAPVTATSPSPVIATNPSPPPATGSSPAPATSSPPLTAIGPSPAAATRLSPAIATSPPPPPSTSLLPPSATGRPPLPATGPSLAASTRLSPATATNPTSPPATGPPPLAATGSPPAIATSPPPPPATSLLPLSATGRPPLPATGSSLAAATKLSPAAATNPTPPPATSSPPLAAATLSLAAAPPATGPPPPPAIGPPPLAATSLELSAGATRETGKGSKAATETSSSVLPGRRSSRAKPNNKRKATAIESSSEGLSADESDDNTSTAASTTSSVALPSNKYAVEAIIDHDFSDPKVKRWHVKWEGCDEYSWVTNRDLYNCLEMLGDYHHKLGLENVHLDLPDVVQKLGGKVPMDVRPDPASELATNLRQLEYLLTESRLESEVVGLVFQFQRAVNGGKEYWSTKTSTSALAALWADHCSSTDRLTECLPYFESKPMDLAFIKLRLLQTSVGILPVITAALHQLNLIGRGFQWELCRSLVSIYQWFSEDSPNLALLVTNIYSESGFKGLSQQSSSFAQLVDHVVQYTYSSLADIAARKKPAKRERTDRVREASAYNNLPTTHFGPLIPAENLSKIPSDMYGLVNAKKSSPIKLPAITGKLPIKVKPLTALYTAARRCLEELWSREIVMPCITTLETHPLVSKTSGNQSTLRDRVITRGAILTCLVDVCKSDAIFASDSMKSFLARPTQDLIPSVQGDSRRASKLQTEDRYEILESIRKSMSVYVDANPGVLALVARLGEVVGAHLSAIHNGGTLDCDNNPLENFCTVNTAEMGSENAVNQANSRKSKATGVSTSFLGPGNDAPLKQVHHDISLAYLAFILREALNRKRGLPVANETLSRVLNGKHPLLSSPVTFPVFQTDPCRQTSEYAQLVEKHLPGNRLTGRTGLSTLLTWMGTGQGCGTRDFLDTIIRPSGFFSYSLQEQLEIFRAAISNNRTLSLQLDSSESEAVSNEPTMKHVPGYMACFDMRIWSVAPNNLFHICPTTSRNTDDKEYMSIEDKFSRYWASSVQDKWVAFIGDMVDEDPSVWTGQRRTWFEVMAFLQGLQIPIFGQGLTVMQTANNLVFAGIVSMPTVPNLAIWIRRERALGAYRALDLLGFTGHHSPNGVTFALTAIYDHLEQHLSDADKKDLGLSPIFLEHVLCKVSRFKSRLNHSKAPSLKELSKRLERDVPPWVVGENLTNHLAIPFPLSISKDRLEEIRATMQ